MAESICKAIVAEIYSKVETKEREYDAAVEMLQMYRANAEFGISCGLEEFDQYHQKLIGAYWQYSPTRKRRFCQSL
jgi:hypothetical protein